MMSRTVFLFVQIIFLQCKINLTEAVKQSGKIIQGYGLSLCLPKYYRTLLRESVLGNEFYGSIKKTQSKLILMQHLKSWT